MTKQIDRFKYIGDINYASDQSRELLLHVGLWESHGKHFINGGAKIGCQYYMPEMLPKVHEVLCPTDYKRLKLVHANGNRLSKGRHLMAKLSSKCKGKLLHP